MSSRCVIPARFNGPVASANGGYACGVLAETGTPAAPGRAVVTLHLPPPVDTALNVTQGSRRAHVWHGDELVATVSTATAEIPVVAPAPAAVAEACHAGFRGFDYHPFPACFVCGVTRPGGDGLALRPGSLPGRPGTVACTWRPDASVSNVDGAVHREVVWAVLDCPGGWTGDPARQTMVLGSMTARIAQVPRLGARYVVVGRSAPQLGRTVTSHTALYHEDGALLAVASTIWVGVAAGDVPPPRPAGTVS